MTFLIENRDGGSEYVDTSLKCAALLISSTCSAGYVATGYWFGLMLGRALLNWVNMRVGEKRV